MYKKKNIKILNTHTIYFGETYKNSIQAKTVATMKYPKSKFSCFKNIKLLKIKADIKKNIVKKKIKKNSKKNLDKQILNLFF